MWDEDDIPSVNNNQMGIESMNGNGFYVGRGRGFGNMSHMADSLPKVGKENSGNDDWDDSGWNETPSSGFKNTQSSGFKNNTQSSGWEEDNWNESKTSDRSSNNWQDRNANYNKRSNDSSRPNRSNKCFKCNEEGHMSRDCPNSDSAGGGSSKGCFSCGESGHMSRDCPSKGSSSRDRNSSREMSCFKCNEKGHISKDCPNGDSRGSSNNRGCFKCGEEGHLSRDCTKEGNSRSCYKCGEDGHLSRDCTKESKSGGKSGCFKCHQDGHMAKDCPNEAVTEDGKPRPPPYVPPEPSEDADSLFMGVPTGINFNKYDNIHVDVSGPNPPAPIESFETSGLCQHLVKNVRLSKYTKPTPVQKYSIPIILQKSDLMACAQTGSGKTAAFLLPILNNMIADPNLPNNVNQDVQQPWAVIVAPTRELVIQIGKEARKFAYDSMVRADVLYGGTSTSYQSNRIKRGCHIIAATPGRLLDFVDKGKVSFAELRYLVLDEADRMLDMGFAPSIRRMVEHPSMPAKGERHTSLFSATFPEEIQRMASEYLHNYLFLTVGVVGAANADISQTFFKVGSFEKKQKLLDILKESGMNRTLVFVEQKRTADFIASICSQNEIPTTSIHGDRLQREREEALRDFCSGRMPVLVATAVAARGLDIRDVSHVVNFDLPQTIDEYVHRIGRTGRVGNLGRATSFYDPDKDQPISRSLKKILIDAQQPVPDWLSEDANSCSGAPMQFRGPRDVRNQGSGRKVDSNDSYDNFNSISKSSFQSPVEEEEDWG